MNILIPALIIFLIRSRHKIVSICKNIWVFLFEDDKDDIILFKGQDSLFKKHINGVDIYGEYGVGDSTIWVANNTNSKIISVDTSQHWIEDVKSKIIENKNLDRLQLGLVDLGELVDWGRPKSYDKRENIINYTQYLWNTSLSPSLVLIDGRFRVACFLMSLMKAEEGTKIIIDDWKEVIIILLRNSSVLLNIMTGKHYLLFQKNWIK